jgi:dihydrolipoamide dehydrogenase
MLHMMNCKVAIIEVMPQILPGEDHEMARGLTDLLKMAGIEIYTNATIEAIRDIKEGKAVAFTTDEGGKEISVEKVISAIGRRPCIEGLELEKIGVKIEGGRIVVDDHMKTNIDNIYAAGDVIGGWMLAHVATAEGVCAAMNIAGIDKRMDYRAVPRCVYTVPELASVGMTENEAKERYDIKIGRFPFNANGRALILNDTFGMVKIIADRKYGEILGVHILGPHATELIAEVVLAIKMEVTFEDFAGVVHAHPTVSEALMEAALDLNGESIHLPPKTQSK